MSELDGIVELYGDVSGGEHLREAEDGEKHINRLAEQALLGSVLMAESWDVFTQAGSLGVDWSKFGVRVLGVVWWSLGQLQDDGQELSEVALVQFLKDRQVASLPDVSARDGQREWSLWEYMGGYATINAATERVEYSASWRGYAAVVLQLWRRREICRLLKAGLERASKPGKSGNEAMVAVQDVLTDLQKLSFVEQEESLDSVIARVAGEMDAFFKGETPPEDPRAMHVGLPLVDRGFGALNPYKEDFQVILAGRPSEGKSALARQVVGRVLGQGKVVCGFLLETTREVWVQQLAANQAEWNIRWTLKQAQEHDRYEDKAKLYIRFMRLIRETADRRLFLFQEAHSLDQICARVREVKARLGHVDLVVVDYLQLVQGNKRLPREQEVADISRTFKMLWKEIGCVGLVLAQLSREVTGTTPPTLRHLRESGSIEQDADRVWFIWRPDKDSNGADQAHGDRKTYEQRLIQAKMRNGPKVHGSLNFRPEYTRFYDPSGIPPEKRGRPKGRTTTN